MLARVSSAELTEWLADLQLDAEDQAKAEQAEKRKGGV